MADADDVVRLRGAVDLALRDARVSLGADVLGVVFERDQIPQELAAGTPLRFGDGVLGYAYVKGEEGYAGIWVPPECDDAALVVRVADKLQELALERSMQYFGRGFPPCPEHPRNAPLFAEVVDSQAMWVCKSGGTTRVPIGQVLGGVGH